MRNFTLENQIIQAISKLKSFRFRYKDELFFRTFNPYVLYHSPADSNRILVGGIRIHNDSKPLEPPAFRKYEVALISQFTITDNSFDYDSGFTTISKEYRNGIISAIKAIKIY